MEYKGYKIVGDGTFGMRHVKGIGKGDIPTALKGVFTGIKDACKAIDMLEADKEGGARGKTKVTGRRK